MPNETRIITGSCLCGAVRWEISPPDHVTACNCSACRRYGAHWAYIPPSVGRVIAEPGATIAYSRGDHSLAFHSCTTCGVTTHWAGLANDRIAVNFRLADDPEELDRVRIRHFDGAESWEFLD
jgi:hypothetical protein